MITEWLINTYSIVIEVNRGRISLSYYQRGNDLKKFPLKTKTKDLLEKKTFTERDKTNA